VRFEQLTDSLRPVESRALETVSEAGDIHEWEVVLSRTRELSDELCQQLRLVLEAKVAAKMRGQFRTGKRLDMRKIIPFIASGFRKDKIWMRRVQPDQRNYQILLAIDNSISMQDTTGGLAIESVCVITQALTLLGIGELAVVKFGDTTELVHPFGQPWNDQSGSALLKAFRFEDEKTHFTDLLETSIGYLQSVKRPGSMQICFILSDPFPVSDRDLVRQFVIQAQLRELLIVFVIIDSQNRGDRVSVLRTKSCVMVDGKPVMKEYLDVFPFPFYVLIQNATSLPEKLADILRQWFDLANSA
jgi:midasin